ncbi:hypothetical protein C0J52_02462, partial [Blattella germanica]
DDANNRCITWLRFCGRGPVVKLDVSLAAAASILRRLRSVFVEDQRRSDVILPALSYLYLGAGKEWGSTMYFYASWQLKKIVLVGYTLVLATVVTTYQLVNNFKAISFTSELVVLDGTVDCTRKLCLTTRPSRAQVNELFSYVIGDDYYAQSDDVSFPNCSNGEGTGRPGPCDMGLFADNKLG